MVNLARNLKFARTLNAVAYGQTNQNGSIIDMSDYEGVVFIAALGAMASDAVAGLKAQTGSAANMSDAADLEGSAVAMIDPDDNTLLVLEIHRPAERYVRAVVTRSTGDSTIDGVIAIQYGPRVLPVTQDNTVAGIKTKASPAEGTA